MRVSGGVAISISGLERVVVGVVVVIVNLTRRWTFRMQLFGMEVKEKKFTIRTGRK